MLWHDFQLYEFSERSFFRASARTPMTMLTNHAYGCAVGATAFGDMRMSMHVLMKNLMDLQELKKN